MSKNIVICLDGTWNDKDDGKSPTNVALLSEMCVNDGANQVSRYIKGVGTDGWYDRKLGGVHGVGLSENVREAYTFLAQNYRQMDRVYIFGFSRGAYTARSLAGFVYRCGLLHESDRLPSDLDRLYEVYKDEDVERMEEHKSSNQTCPIEMIGVWDTVGALGIPVSVLGKASEKLIDFHDTKLSPEVQFARHAVAIDERRASFEPTLWRETPENGDKLKQVWFPGVHSDVGGGYPERHHSDVALKWMVDQATDKGLLVKEDVAYEYHINLRKKIHTSAFELFGKAIGVEERDAPVEEAIGPKVHKSVLEKMILDKYYQPLALKNHLAGRDTLEPYDVEE